MTTQKDIEHIIKIGDPLGLKKIFIDAYDDGVWFSMALPNGSAYITLTIEEAKQVVEALTAVINASVEAI